jgi:hypothetical protein
MIDFLKPFFSTYLAYQPSAGRPNGTHFYGFTNPAPEPITPAYLRGLYLSEYLRLHFPVYATFPLFLRKYYQRKENTIFNNRPTGTLSHWYGQKDTPRR